MRPPASIRDGSLHGTGTLSDGRESIALEGFNARPVVGIHLLRVRGAAAPCVAPASRAGAWSVPPRPSPLQLTPVATAANPVPAPRRSEETAARKRWAGLLLRTVSDWEVIHGTPP